MDRQNNVKTSCFNKINELQFTSLHTWEKSAGFIRHFVVKNGIYTDFCHFFDDKNTLYYFFGYTLI